MGYKKKPIPFLAETDFWRERGERLYIAPKLNDPARMRITAKYRLTVKCEGCGKTMYRRLDRWVNGKTRCSDCQKKHMEEEKAAARAKREAERLAKTLWSLFPWQVIRMWDWKNNEVRPTEHIVSSQVVHLVCPKCGKPFEKTVRSLTRSLGGKSKGRRLCPHCHPGVNLSKPVAGVNDLATTHPEIAAHWHPTKNGDLKPSDVFANSIQRVWWVYDNGEEGLCQVRGKVLQKNPFERPCGHTGDEQPIDETHPWLVSQWDAENNEGHLPSEFTYGSHYKAAWICPDCGYRWRAEIKSRVMGSGCPKCAKRGMSSGEKLVKKALDILRLDYQVERRFDTCRNIAPLPFDFAITVPSSGEVFMLVEFQGQQHYHEIGVWGGEEGLRNRQRCDQIKRDWCEANGIRLLEIPYTTDDLMGVVRAICRAM